MRCRLGLHRWLPWRHQPIFYVNTGQRIGGQKRRCRRCGLEKIREL